MTADRHRLTPTPTSRSGPEQPSLWGSLVGSSRDGAGTRPGGRRTAVAVGNVIIERLHLGTEAFFGVLLFALGVGFRMMPRVDK